jgi:hypothetical protein
LLVLSAAKLHLIMKKLLRITQLHSEVSLLIPRVH